MNEAGAGKFRQFASRIGRREIGAAAVIATTSVLASIRTRNYYVSKQEPIRIVAGDCRQPAEFDIISHGGPFTARIANFGEVQYVDGKIVAGGYASSGEVYAYEPQPTTLPEDLFAQATARAEGTPEATPAIPSSVSPLTGSNGIKVRVAAGCK